MTKQCVRGAINLSINHLKQYAAECVDETKLQKRGPYEVVHRSISTISEEELREIQKKACKLA